MEKSYFFLKSPHHIFHIYSDKEKLFNGFSFHKSYIKEEFSIIRIIIYSEYLTRQWSVQIKEYIHARIDSKSKKI